MKCQVTALLLAFVFVFAGMITSNTIAAQSSSKPTCAVMTLKGLEGVSEDLALMLSERMFNEIGKSGKYQMIERTQAERVLKENQIAMVCADTSRAIEAGKILAAEYIVIGSIGKIGNVYSINSRLVSIESGAVIELATTDHHWKKEDLLITAVNNARQLMKLPLETIPDSLELVKPSSTNSTSLMVVDKAKSDKSPPLMPDLRTAQPIELAWIPDGDLVVVPREGRGIRRVIPIQGFWMSTTEIAQDQWQSVMGANPSSFKGSRNPVENISWRDANEFCAKLELLVSAIAATNGGARTKVRLPTNTEWEYACRAGTATKYNTGDDTIALAKAAWYRANSKKTTHPVGTKAANNWGLFDMHGNVSEWCDNFALSSSHKIIKGGSYADDEDDYASGYSDDRRPGGSDKTLGFRIVIASF